MIKSKLIVDVFIKSSIISVINLTIDQLHNISKKFKNSDISQQIEMPQRCNELNGINTHLSIIINNIDQINEILSSVVPDLSLVVPDLSSDLSLVVPDLPSDMSDLLQDVIDSPQHVPDLSQYDTDLPISDILEQSPKDISDTNLYDCPIRQHLIMNELFPHYWEISERINSIDNEAITSTYNSTR